MKEIQNNYPAFDLLSSDEWDHVRSIIEDELDFLNKIDLNDLSEAEKGSLLINTIMQTFEQDLKGRLQNEGLDRDLIDDANELSYITQGNDYFKLPEHVLEFSRDKKEAYLREDIRSCINSLLTLSGFRDDAKNIIVNGNEYYRIFLKTLLLLIDVFRAGAMKDIVRGIAVKRRASEGGALSHQKDKERHEQYQHDADIIWSNNHNLNLSKKSVATHLSRKYRDDKDLRATADAISRIIIKKK